MRILPDYLRNGLRLLIVGCNPGLRSARLGHYYAGRNNQFWPLLFESGIVPEPLDYGDDRRLIEFGIGVTDLVKRPSRGIGDLERQDFAEGRVLLAKKLEQYRPRVIAFNGKAVYEKFAGRPCTLGPQKETLYGARVFVLPSTSGLNAGLARNMKRRYFRQLARLLAKMKDTQRGKPQPTREEQPKALTRSSRRPTENTEKNNRGISDLKFENSEAGTKRLLIVDSSRRHSEGTKKKEDFRRSRRISGIVTEMVDARERALREEVLV